MKLEALMLKWNMAIFDYRIDTVFATLYYLLERSYSLPVLSSRVRSGLFR